MSGEGTAPFQGNLNTENDDLCGFRFVVRLDARNLDLYQEWVAAGVYDTLPVELYNTYLLPFSRDEELTHRHIPLKSAVIDSTSIRTNGDPYLSKILKDILSSKETIDVARAFRTSVASFAEDGAIVALNGRIKDAAHITDRELSLSVEPPNRSAWESSILTYIDDVPFYNNGKGEQSVLKTKIALSHRKTKTRNLLLIEEPENHLSHATLNGLLTGIKEARDGRQVVITTHSNFVANKLGLASIVFLGPGGHTRLGALDKETQDFFEKAAGYDTLRMLLCKKAILVEGSSDELVVQKAYMVENGGRLPIEDGIDVISVGVAFERFLKLARNVGATVRVVTDNDGDPEFITEKYKDYVSESVKICFDHEIDTGQLIIGTKPYNYNTLEPKLIKANGLDLLNKVFGTNFKELEELQRHMYRNKADCALGILKTSENLTYPQYILDAIR